MERRWTPYTEISEDIDGNLRYASGSIEAPPGSVVVPLRSRAEIESFRADPEGFFARRHGATVAEYLVWIETEGGPRCGGYTVKGKRCRNLISNPFGCSFSEWLRLDRNEYCAVHGGPGSRRERAR